MAEHGFAAMIERDGLRMLFDTGQGPALAHNAPILGVDLSGLNTVALSHGHYDHTGGLLHVTRLNPGIRVVAHPKALGGHMALNDDETIPHDIGLPHRPKSLEEHGARFHLTTRFEEILDRVWFTGWIPRKNESRQDKRLLTPDMDGWRPDIIEDDASLVLETNSGFALLLGCAHAGVRNILEHVKQEKGIDRIHAVVGGTHLGFSGASETVEVIRALESFGVQCVATAHCTGEAANLALRNHFGDRFRIARAGTILRF